MCLWVALLLLTSGRFRFENLQKCKMKLQYVLNFTRPTSSSLLNCTLRKCYLIKYRFCFPTKDMISSGLTRAALYCIHFHSNLNPALLFASVSSVVLLNNNPFENFLLRLHHSISSQPQISQNYCYSPYFKSQIGIL